MPNINRFADFHEEIVQWRQDLHTHPELLYEVQRTAGVVAEKLREFGVDDVVEGIGQTGVVGIIHGRGGAGGKAIGLRADMDALPIREIRDLPHKSVVDGKMHACGHDGHTAMLLGAAKYLAETRHFDGSVAVIFQPAEEGGAGGKAMVDDGMMEQFSIEEVYGMHNMPGLAVGEFAIRAGPLMAAADFINIDIEGLGGHAATPNLCIDPVLVASHIHTALQSIVSRNTDPLESAVISITQIHAGDADNVIPQIAYMTGTVRTLTEEVRKLCEVRINELATAIATGFGATATVNYRRGYPVTANHVDQTRFAAKVAASVVGAAKVNADTPPIMCGEDFSYMLNARPGAFIFVGQGDTAGLHHPEYDFNDDIIPVGCSYWAQLVEQALPVGGV